MHVNFFQEDNSAMPVNMMYQSQKPKKKYGIIRFLFDSLMVTLTGGLWLIWIFVREMRKR